MNRALAREHAAPAMNQRATQRSRVQAHRNLIGKTGENAALDRARLRFVALQIEFFVTGDGEKLLGELGGFAGGAGVDTELRATARIEAALFRVAKRAHQDEKIGFGFTAQDVVAIFAGLFAVEATKEIPSLGERGDQRDRRDAVIFLCGEQHSRVTRMDREREHATTEPSHPARGNCTEIGE